jgi:hypothetical protein
MGNSDVKVTNNKNMELARTIIDLVKSEYHNLVAYPTWSSTMIGIQIKSFDYINTFSILKNNNEKFEVKYFIKECEFNNDLSGYINGLKFMKKQSINILNLINENF